MIQKEEKEALATQAGAEEGNCQEALSVPSGAIMGREEQEEEEYKLLSPLACKSRDSRGRERPEKKCDIRTEFQRDRDRIIHSKSFRRLMHKTQVFIKPDQDHFRTRLTHTLEVAQIARTIARALRLNEDLTEAIALGHDLGHTPFGHSGEKCLSDVRYRHCRLSFKHNVQSERLVDLLEEKADKRGMNLTLEVRDGILNHTGQQTPMTLEGQVVKISDRIAYINHDIDDAIRANIIDEDFLEKEVGDYLAVIGRSHKKRIDSLVRDLIYHSLGESSIRQSPEMKEALDALRNFMFKKVYNNDSEFRKNQQTTVKEIIEGLYFYYLEKPCEMPEGYLEMVDDYGVEEVVKDYIAGMTDRFAMERFEEIRAKL